MIELLSEIADELKINPPKEILERMVLWYEKRCKYSEYSRENARAVLVRRMEILKQFRSPNERDNHLRKIEAWISQIVPPSLKRNAPDYLGMLQSEAWLKFQQESNIQQCRNKWEEAEWWGYFYAYPKRRIKGTGKTLLQTRIYDWVKRCREYPTDFEDYEIGYTEDNLLVLDWEIVHRVFVEFLCSHNQQGCVNYSDAYLKYKGNVRAIEAALNIDSTQRDYLQQRTKYWSGKFLTDAKELVKIRDILELSLPTEFDELVMQGDFKAATRLLRSKVDNYRQSTTNYCLERGNS